MFLEPDRCRRRRSFARNAHERASATGGSSVWLSPPTAEAFYREEHQRTRRVARRRCGVELWRCGRSAEVLFRMAACRGLSRLCFQDALRTAGFGTGVGDPVALAAMHVAAGLVGGNVRSIVPLRGYIPDTFPETAAAKLIGAAEEVYGIVGAVGRDAGFHGAEMLVT